MKNKELTENELFEQEQLNIAAEKVIEKHYEILSVDTAIEQFREELTEEQINKLMYK